MNDLINEFNKKDSLLVISSYPDPTGEPAKQNAVACYAQNLFNAYKKRNVIVLSEKKDGSTMFRKDNVLVVPCWKPASPFLYLQLLRMIFRLKNTKNLLFQFEFNMLGSFVHTALLPFFFGFLRVMGKKVTIVQHQVIGDLSVLNGHLNIKKNSLKATILNQGIWLFYYLVGIFANAVIVHEDYLRTKLSKWVKIEKIFVVSHGLELSNLAGESRRSIRERLGFDKKDFVLLVFGYVAWYKGTDWLIKKVAEINHKHPKEKIKIIIAGGPSATLQSKAHYRRYLAKIRNLIEENEKFVVGTGFVPENEVYEYFKASDLVVLPYRVMMSASGPLSFALRFAKPYIVSDVLKESFENQDVQLAKLNSGIDLKNITFSMKGDDFVRKIISVERMRYLPKAKQFVNYLRQLRTWDNIVVEYEKVVFGLPNVGIIDYLRGFTRRVSSKVNILKYQDNV